MQTEKLPTVRVLAMLNVIIHEIIHQAITVRGIENIGVEKACEFSKQKSFSNIIYCFRIIVAIHTVHSPPVGSDLPISQWF